MLKIGVVCNHSNAYLFEQNPFVDNVHIVKKRSIISYIKQGYSLRALSYDAVIDLTVFLRNRDLLLLRLISPALLVGYQKENYRLFNRHIVSKHHFADIYRLAIELLGFTVTDMRYEVPYDAQSERDILSFLQQYQLRDYIAVNFYGASSSRKFSNQRIQEFCHYFQQFSSRQFVILCTLQEAKNLSSLIAPFSNSYLYPYSKNISYAIPLIRNADMLITPDTSIVHIGVGLGKKLIAFYSNDANNFVSWHPNSRMETHILRFDQHINEITPNRLQVEWLSNKSEC